MKKNQLILASIVLALAVLLGTGLYQPKSDTQRQKQVAVTPATTTDDDVVLGNPDAPVTMVVFGDYECPFCKKAFDEAEAKVRDEYIAAGTVKMVFRDYPLNNIHEYAQKAAEAAQCAAPQNKYWQYHDALFMRQNELGKLDYTALAGELGLDTVAFKACFDAGTYASEVAKDQSDGAALGVNGTPATFINGELIGGAYPYDTYKQIIDEALRKAERGW